MEISGLFGLYKRLSIPEDVPDWIHKHLTERGNPNVILSSLKFKEGH